MEQLQRNIEVEIDSFGPDAMEAERRLKELVKRGAAALRDLKWARSKELMPDDAERAGKMLAEIIKLTGLKIPLKEVKRIII